MGYSAGRFILSKEARGYLIEASYGIRKWCDKNKVAPISRQFYLDMHFHLADNRSDSHNYKKILFDALEKGGLVTNDKIILDRTQSVDIDTSNPRVELVFENGI